MQFSEILKIDRAAASEGSRADILGDGFLLTQNPTYRKIKTLAIEIGVTFEEATAQYLLLPFQQLDQIVATKIVPYVPHGRLVREIEARRPGAFSLEQMTIPESYHLHEAAHVIAADHCSKLDTKTKQAQILKAILCESFANTADALACGYADSDLHRIFLKLNCYMVPTEDVYEVMASVRQKYGEEFTARLVLLSYLHANFLREEVSPDLFGAGSDEEECLLLSEIGQQLDLQFRVQTTENYLHLSGIDGAVLEMVDFDFMQLLKREDFARAFNQLVTLI